MLIFNHRKLFRAFNNSSGLRLKCQYVCENRLRMQQDFYNPINVPQRGNSKRQKLDTRNPRTRNQNKSFRLFYSLLRSEEKAIRIYILGSERRRHRFMIKIIDFRTSPVEGSERAREKESEQWKHKKCDRRVFPSSWIGGSDHQQVFVPRVIFIKTLKTIAVGRRKACVDDW